MKRIWLLIFLLIMFSSCGSPSVPTSVIPAQIINSAGIASVDVKMSRADLSIRNSATDQITINGRILGSDMRGFSVDIQNEILSIQFKDEERGFDFTMDDGNGNVLDLEVPGYVPLAVEIFDGNVKIIGDFTFLDIDSVSASIEAEDISGWIRLRSGRGDISLGGGSGEYHLLGEHGRIAMTDINGRIEASTILGNIEYSGVPGMDDDINLEVDHGSIFITMLPEANLRYSLQTANGEVFCIIPDSIKGPNTCGGLLGEGAGMLKARSVSGKIVIESQP